MTEPIRGAAVKRANGVVPRPKPDVEIGVGQHNPFTTPYKANAHELLRNEQVTVSQLVKMRQQDGQARALYRLLTLPIRAALKTATVIPADGVEGGEEEADFIRQMFNLPASAGGMLVPFHRVIAQMLMALFDGFSAFEMVYWVPKNGPLKNKWTLKKLAYRPAETLTFILDKDGNFTGLRQQTYFNNEPIDRFLEADHVVYYAANEEERPYYGQSYFQAAYYHWDKKYKLYIIAHVASERAALGTRIGKVPNNPNSADLENFKRGLAELGFAQHMTIPANYEVESLKEGGGFDFLAFINHHNSQMSKSILAEFFDEQQGSGGDTTLVDFGRQSDALFMLMLQTIMREIEEVINQQIIPRFIYWNFNSDKYPQFTFGTLTEEQKSALLDIFKHLATAGQSLTIHEQFVHEVTKQVAEEFGLELDWNTIEEEMAARAEAEAEMAEQQQMMGGQPGAGASAPAASGPVDVPAALVPDNFTLTNAHDTASALTDLARDLLHEAHDTIALTRGVPTHGGPKVVRTAAGARVYGVPIGTPITRDIAERTAAEGVKGKPYGAGKRAAKSRTGGQRAGGGLGDTRTERQRLGGGTGAAADIGGVVTEPAEAADLPKPERVLSHPDAPGAQLLDFGDGTVAIRDGNGNMSPRQKAQMEKFLKLGWQVARKGKK